MMSEHLSQNEQKERLARHFVDRRILVCCGAGGVGKTTTAAALGVAAAMRGQKVLVLTIDPARRLADALGIPIHSEKPQQVDPAQFTPYGVTLEGELSLWMLQPEPVFDEMVETLSPSAENVTRLQEMSIYQAIRQLVAGMQEYMAGESLYQFYTHGGYDLIILDTPPSRNAIDFLNAPERILRFFDSRILRVFAPSQSRWSIRNRARKLVQKTFEQVAGDGFLSQVQEFVALFLDIFDVLKEHAQTVQEVLASQAATHLLITSPDPMALQEALYFQEYLTTNQIPFGGFVLNRSLADHPTRHIPPTGEDAEKSLQSAVEKLQPLMEVEKALVMEHQQLVERLLSLSSTHAMTIATPHLGEDVEDLRGLILLANILLPTPSS